MRATREDSRPGIAKGIALGSALALGALTTSCTVEETPVYPAMVFVQKNGGHTLLQGCFTGFGDKNIRFDAVGTLTLKPEANNEWKFTFTTVDGKHNRDIDTSELRLAKVYDPGKDPIYTAPKEKKDEQEHRAQCREDLPFGRGVPDFMVNKFAAPVIHNRDGVTKFMYGPITSDTFIRPTTTTGDLGEHVTPVSGINLAVRRIIP
jgi:hypothetical protein